MDDGVVSVGHAFEMARALNDCGVKAELHIFPHGRHGIGISAKNPIAHQWCGLFQNWLKSNGF